MSTRRHEILAWMGPAAEDATDEQVAALAAAADLIDARYPGAEPGDGRPESAMAAAAQVILGDDTLEQIAAAWQAARRAERTAMAELTGAMIAASRTVSQSEISRVANVDRMTVRKALGLR